MTTNFKISKTDNGWTIERRDEKSFNVDWSEVSIYGLNFEEKDWQEAINFCKKLEGF